MNELVVIEGKEIERVHYMEQPILSFEMVDLLHERPDGTARRTFNENKSRFIEGRDFVRIPYAEWVSFGGRNTSAKCPVSSSEKVDKRGGDQGGIVLLFMNGYLKVVKPMKDDRSWRIQDILIESYFQLKELRQTAKYVALLEDIYLLAMKNVRTNKPWTPADKERLRELKAQGLIDSEVGRQMGRNRSSVHYELKGGKEIYRRDKETPD